MAGPWEDFGDASAAAGSMQGGPWEDFGGKTEGPMSWGGVGSQAVSNLGQSAGRFASDIAQPFLHPIDTAKNLGNLGLGLLEKTQASYPGTGTPLTSGHEQYADAVGEFFKNRYGSMENFKHTLATDPVGVAGDLSAIFSGGETALARAPGIVGKVGQAAGKVGRAIDPLRLPLNVAKTAGDLGAEALGVTTGAGSKAIKTAAGAGYAGGTKAQDFLESMRGNTPLDEVVDDARIAVLELRRQRGDAYTQAMQRVGADQTILDFNDIDNAVSNAVRIKTFKGQSLSPSTEGIRQEMTSAINQWKLLDPAEYHTPIGMDALKQKLGDMRDATAYGTPERKAASEIYGAVRAEIIRQVPEYAGIMKGYEQASDLIKEIEGTLSVNPGARVDTTLRKLQSVLRDNVNTSYGYRGELAKYLVNAGAPNLLEKLSGQALSNWAPRGLSRLAAAETLMGGMGAGAGAAAAGAHGALGLGALAALPGLAMASPKLAGYGAYGIGLGGRLGAQALDKLGPLGSLPYGNIARGARQLGRIDSNPFNPSP